MSDLGESTALKTIEHRLRRIGFLLSGHDHDHDQEHYDERTVTPRRMSDSEESTALKTIELLEHRLRRISFLLSGYDHYDGEEILQEVAAKGKDNTVQARMAKIEHDLNRISYTSPIFRDLLKLRVFS